MTYILNGIKVKYISSLKNIELKELQLLLKKGKERKKSCLFIIEGERELQKAIKANYIIRKIYTEEGSYTYLKEIIKKYPLIPIVSIKREVFKKITRRSGSEKILALVKSKTHNLDDLKLSDNSLLLVIEAPEKPGNIGAIFRTAVASKMDAIIVANPKTDFYNPNSIRSSLGSIFLIQTALANSKEIISFLNKNSFNIGAAVISKDSINYDSFDYKTPCAIVLGAENSGLDNCWLELNNQKLIIPMAEEIDSLNLSVSAGILMYEARRKNIAFENNSII